MIKRLIALACLLLLSSACIKQTSPGEIAEVKTISVGSSSNQLQVEVANTDSLREKGLSDRDSLPEDHGMLFDFSNTEIDRPNFWMKGMRFDLDFIWVKNNQIIAVTENVPAAKTPDETLPFYTAPDPVDTVIEINAGWIKRHNVKVGDKLTY